MIRKLLLAIAILVAFSVGYGATAEAWPGVPDRDRWYGYFKNQRDPFGLDVMNGGVPGWVQNADTFISFIRGKLAAGPGTQDGVGAAFIIQTMIGLDRSLPPQAWQVAEWEQRVRYAEARGLVDFNLWLGYSVNSYYQDGPVDDAFYYENGASSTITFRDTSGNILYAIRRECVNPVGTVNAIQDQPNFSITGRSTVSDATAFPGQTVTFSHFLRNAGPDSATIDWQTRDGFSNGVIRSGSSGIGAGREINVGANENFTVPMNAAFGTQYCRYISFAPAVNGTGSGRGANVCTQVVPDFEVFPTVVPSSSTAQQNDVVTFTHRVTVTGNTRTTNLTCKIAGHSPGPGYTPLPQQDADRNPAVNPQPATNCNREIPLGGPQTIATETVDVGNLAPGSRICRSLVINPRAETGGFRASAEACIVIAKSPYVHFKGNDVWAGGGFQAVTPACNTVAKIQTSAHTLRDGSVAGSAVEYAGFALGRIMTFGTANKALIDPAGPFGKTLTFSNVDSNNLGNYSVPPLRHCIEDYITRFSSVPITGLPGAIDVNRASGTWHVTGNRTFSGNVPAGSLQVYLVEGDVTITGTGIRYPGSYNGLNDIPSLVIIATGNITVQAGVTQMDGIFITRQTLTTCNPPPGNLTVSICNNQLVVNGAVIARRLSLLRTHGADGNNDTSRKVPAEVFNFPAEIYLRNALTGTNGNILRTVDQKDLPPRF